MTPAKPPSPRRGRPRAEDAGEADRRILEAATAVFLRLGYGRATIELIAEEAQAGKTTVYARYASKAELFSAVVTQPGSTPPFADVAPSDEISPLERLATAGYELADVTLTPHSIALMRATLAETDSFPQVAGEGFRIGFEACSRHIARAMGATTDDEEVAKLLPRAQRFVELTMHPLYMHAFFGADLGELRTRARTCVDEVAPSFVSAEAPS